MFLLKALITKSRIAVLILFTLFLLQGCGGGGSSSGGGMSDDPGNGQVTSIVTIGDSIGVGVGFGSRTPWPNNLARILGVPLLENRSRGSQQTAWGLDQINGLLDRHPTASHVVIMIGINDARVGSVGGAVSNLQEMANIANNRGVIPVIGTITINLRTSSGDARAQRINAGIRGISGAIIAETRQAIGDGRTLLADLIHPTDQGQIAIAQAFADAIQ